MKLLFTHLSTEKISGQPPLGVAYICSYIKKYSDIEVAIVDKEKDTLEAIKKQKPDIIGISSVTKEFARAIKLAKEIKNELNIPIILGGNHITIMPNLPKEFDIGVLGEAEETMLELMQYYQKHGKFDKKDLRKIKGICFNDPDTIVNERRALIQPLDKIPYPARELFDMEKHYLVPRRAGTAKKVSRATHLFTSRGCPFNCRFCSSSHFWQRKLRMFSPEYVVGEMKLLVDKYHLEEILIFDDLFASDVERLRKIVELAKKEGIPEKVNFGCLCRVDLFGEERARLLKELNVLQIDFGFESGSQRILKYLKRDTTTVEMNREAIRVAKKYGFNTHGFFMIGAPDETKEEMMETLKFIKENPIDSVTLCVVTPYPGTDIWDYAKERGLVNDHMEWDKLDLTPEGGNFIYLNTTMPKEEFLKLYENFKKQIEKNQYAVEFKLKSIFTPFIIKWALTHPGEAWKYFYNSLKPKLKRGKSEK